MTKVKSLIQDVSHRFDFIITNNDVKFILFLTYLEAVALSATASYYMLD
jgi:hypothetical protein